MCWQSEVSSSSDGWAYRGDRREYDLILIVIKAGRISLRLLMSLSFYNWGLVKKCQLTGNHCVVPENAI